MSSVLTRNNMDTSETKDGQGKDATVLMPGQGTETHGSPASKEGILEDEGKK